MQLLQHDWLNVLLVLFQVFNSERNAGVNDEGGAGGGASWTGRNRKSGGGTDTDRKSGGGASVLTCAAFAVVHGDVADAVAVGDVARRPGETQDGVRREEER